MANDSASLSWSSDARGGGAGRTSRPYRERPLDYQSPVFCHCQRKAARFVSWSNDNPGKRDLRDTVNDLKDENAHLVSVGREREQELEELRKMIEFIIFTAKLDDNFSSDSKDQKLDCLLRYCLVLIKKTDLEGSAHLRDDSFDIKCGVTVMKEICSKETNKGKQFVVVPPGDLHHHLGNLLVNMDGTDVTFDVGQERFLAHRCVLAARSSIFKAEFFDSMNAKDRRIIKIEDMEAGVFRSLLHFIYTDTLPDASQDVVMAQHLLVAADRYNVERLKLICEEKLSKNLDSDMLATSLSLAEQHGCPGLKEACFEFLASPSNLESVMASEGYEHLKSSCPSVLTEFMARYLPPEMKALASSISKDAIA
ncbi:hypothetical protein ABZP36_000583 [Zizania latifolia]